MLGYYKNITLYTYIQTNKLIYEAKSLGLSKEALFLKKINNELKLLLLLLEKKSQSTNTLYIWRTKDDDKVRESHIANNGLVFSYANPPPTGNPGEEYGCRCYAIELPKFSSIALSLSTLKVSIYNPNGEQIIRSGGSRAWRNNNPGNLRAGAFSKRHGSIGEAGGFAVFPDEKIGNLASKALLQSPNYSLLTIDEAIAKRSPSSENNLIKLQQDIRHIGCFSGKEIIGSLSDAEMDRLLEAIKRTEGWIEGTISILKPNI